MVVNIKDSWIWMKMDGDNHFPFTFGPTNKKLVYFLPLFLFEKFPAAKNLLCFLIF